MSITREFLRHPVRTGAIAASSPALAEAMTAGLGLERAATVVELGPGTGVFTRAVLDRLPPGARMTVVEINPRLAADLRRRFAHDPVEVVEDSAETLAARVTRPVDAVVSGLPWTVMSDALQARILDAVTAVLAPEGRFSTFAYAHVAWTPPARRFAAAVRARFSVVERSPVVWANLPPAFVHRAALPVASRTEQRRGQSATATS
ncbi:class I SAM-dependent methyltransferase [Amycolatopsis samaneae]|uniref:Class I SAM-dependent methyltransferase n=1 Tax=Amycolatopsis samaneae TaxID=664691 RepID=A0ABW5GVZ3_9PSEU